MRRAIVIGLLLLTVGLLQTALFPFATMAGFRPDLILLVAVAFAYRDGPITGTLVGFFAGLLADLLVVQPPVGLNAIVLLAIGYGVGLSRPYLAMAPNAAPLAVAAASAVLATVGHGLLARLLGDPRFTVQLIAQSSVLVAVYNTLLSPVVFWIVGRITVRFPPSRPAEL